MWVPEKFPTWRLDSWMSGGWKCLLGEGRQVLTGAGMPNPGYSEGGGRVLKAGPLVLLHGWRCFRTES